MSEGNARFEAIVEGRVQGVAFRYATQQKAAELGVGGTVRNRGDGSVQVRAQGPEDAVRRLLSWLHVGPPLAIVERVEVTWQTPIEGSDGSFEVRY